MLPGRTYTPDVVLQTAWRYRWLILLPFIVISASVFAYSHTLPNLYRSETIILVVPQRIPETYVRATVTSRIEDRLRTLRQQILSRTRLEQVILEFNLYANERTHLPMEQVVEIMRQQVETETVRGDSFRIGFVAHDSMTPVRVVTRLADMFIEEDQRDRAVIADDTNKFLESQLSDARARLLEHERKLEEYRVRHAGALPSQFQSNLQVIQATRTQIQSIEESINRDRDRRLVLEKSLAEVENSDFGKRLDSAALAGPQVSNSPIDQLEAARAELRVLERTLKPTHPDVIAKQQEIQGLESQLSAGVRRSDAPAGSEPGEPLNTAEFIRRTRARQIREEIEKIDAQIAQREADVLKLQQTVVDYQARVEAVPARETEMIELMRDYETLQRIYTGLLAKKEDSKIAANLERKQIGEQFKVLDPARPAERPFSPNRVRINLAGSLVGLLLGMSLAGLREYRDTRLRNRDDVVMTLALPVLAVIPVMESRRERRNRHLRLAFTGMMAIAGLVAIGTVVALKYDWMEWPL